MTDADITTRQPLDAGRIVDAGMAVADAEGVDALTMRRIADELGYKVMALYRHVANKDELLALMADAVAGTIPRPEIGDAPLSSIREHTIETRDALARHPWAPVLWLRTMPGPNRIDHMEFLLAAFAETGLPDELAHHGFHAINNHVIGFTIQAQEMAVTTGDQSMEELAKGFVDSLDAERHRHSIAHVHQHLEGDTGSSFELVLDLILDGLVRVADD